MRQYCVLNLATEEIAPSSCSSGEDEGEGKRRLYGIGLLNCVFWFLIAAVSAVNSPPSLSAANNEAQDIMDSRFIEELDESGFIRALLAK